MVRGVFCWSTKTVDLIINNLKVLYVGLGRSRGIPEGLSFARQFLQGGWRPRMDRYIGGVGCPRSNAIKRFVATQSLPVGIHEAC